MSNNKQIFVMVDASSKKIQAQGDWTLPNIKSIQNELKKSIASIAGDSVVDGSHVQKLDSAGAWLLNSYAHKKKITLTGFSKQHMKLLQLVAENEDVYNALPKKKSLKWLPILGKFSLGLYEEFMGYLAFVGKLSVQAFGLIIHPRRFRMTAVVNVIDSAGFRALPIIALLSFMIGIVIAYQMGTQLRNYGANLFIVDFLGLSILREFGPLLTAIMVSGRTGSAFTAQLGTMKINQEIDALNTLGVTPGELLLLPRILGLLIALPLLTMWANLFGVLGGMIMAHNMLGMTPYDFLSRFSHVIPLKTLLIGLGKAPVFALVIATIGCFEGMRVHGSADSVGKQTTRSVVLAIFFIIVIDAIFSVVLSKMNL